jgi:CTP:molybdopterin cytidylyltransferase MocA
MRIGAVLLAAHAVDGLHGLPAALVRLQGVSFIRRQLVALSGAGVDEVAIVTGAARHAVEDEIRPFSVRLAHVADEGRDEGAAIRAGLKALEGPFDAIFILPGELVLIGSGDLVELIGAFKKRAAGNAVVPFVDAERGAPMLVDTAAQAQRVHGEVDFALAHRHDSGNQRFVTRLARASDIESLAGRTGWRFEIPEMEAVF